MSAKLRRCYHWILLAAIWSGYSLVFSASEATAQEIRSTLFAEADSALEVCNAARVDILAPKTFGEAMKHYRRAEEGLERGRNLESIRRELGESQSYMARALDAARLAEVTFVTVLAARDGAEGADAPGFALEGWEDAEKKFEEAARELEDGDVNSAKRKASEAEGLYREAELEAIKANFLTEAWAMLAEAERLHVERRAPKTLERAQQLASQAEQMLNESRYDTDEPRSLAQQAKYEAQHALYLAARVEEVERGQVTLEDVILAGEQPLQRVAGAMDIVASFESGPERVTEDVVNGVVVYQDSIERLETVVSAGREQISGLEARIDELVADLGGAEREKSELSERIAAQARLRDKFSRLEGMFDRDQARVLREGNDVIVRLVGLTFAVGKSDIEPQYFGLLTLVQRAISEFPGSRVTIEGHTDSFGSDAENQTLSRDRAEAVRQYLLATGRFDPSLIDAIGYGETRPVASNEISEGRAKNRRIEIVIHPRLSASD